MIKVAQAPFYFPLGYDMQANLRTVLYFLILQVAAPEIAMIKIAAPNMTQRVCDRAMQAFGGMGVCEDTPIASKGRITSSVIRWLPRKKYAQPIHKIEPVSSHSVFFLGNGHNTPGVFLA